MLPAVACAAAYSLPDRYSFSTKLGLSSKQLANEKPSSSSLRQLQRLGRLSSEIELQRRDTKDLVVQIEEVSNSLGVEHKVSNFDSSFIHRVRLQFAAVLQPPRQLLERRLRCALAAAPRSTTLHCTLYLFSSTCLLLIVWANGNDSLCLSSRSRILMILTHSCPYCRGQIHA